MGGSGGGGGSSGQVDYPEYMKTYHESWLVEMDVHLDTLVNNNPYATASAYNPDGDLSNSASAIAIFYAALTAIDAYTNWNSAYDLVNNKYGGSVVIAIQDQIDAYTEITDNEIETKILPQFKRGMQNANASMGSAFVIGEALIWADRNRNLSKFQTDLALKNADLTIKNRELITQNIQVIFQNIVQEAELWKGYAHYMLEHNRLKIIAKSEQASTNLEYDVKDARWEVGAYTEASNLLAGISGATSQGTTPNTPSKAVTALGGAISGAAAGAMIGSAVPGIGTGIGALGGLVVGAAGGLLG